MILYLIHLCCWRDEIRYTWYTCKGLITFNIQDIWFTFNFKEGKYNGIFKFGGKYKNQIKISNKYNSSIIKRVFSPPDDENLNLKLVTKKRKQNIKIKKDNCFRNFFNEILKIINKKKYSFYYKRMEQDIIFRSNLI